MEEFYFHGEILTQVKSLRIYLHAYFVYVFIIYFVYFLVIKLIFEINSLFTQIIEENLQDRSHLKLN